MGWIAVKQGDFDLAKSHFRRALFPGRDLRDLRNTWESFEGIATLAVRGALGKSAAYLLGAASALKAGSEETSPVPDATVADDWVHSLQQSLGTTVFAAAWDDGRAMRLEEGVEFALRTLDELDRPAGADRNGGSEEEAESAPSSPPATT